MEGEAHPRMLFVSSLICVCRFLQFGSPHGTSAAHEYIAAQRNEVWVNIGYRLSAFGFLAAEEQNVSGNFGFKDQWLGLMWVKENISAFGGGWKLFRSSCRGANEALLGDPEDITITGLSAGTPKFRRSTRNVN
jgi:carboxylesterase type B